MKKIAKTKELEMKVLRELRRDSSASISSIARKLKAPMTTVFEAERKLKREGILTRYLAALNFENAGFPIRACFLMKIEDEKLKETAGMLMASKNVNTLQVLEGSCNLFAEAVFRTIGQFLAFSEKLDKADKKSVYYVLEEAKTEAAAVCL